MGSETSASLEFPALPIRRVSRLDLVADDWRWPFARERSAAIAAYFARLQESKPAIWNGRVLLARDPQFVGDTFHARYFETDFASFLMWRDLGFPDTSVFNGFGMGALCGSDGGFLLGEMGQQTANAGRIYFASGMIDGTDRHGDRIDMPANVEREVREETGLTPNDYSADETWDIVQQAGRVAMIRKLRARNTMAELHHRVTTFIARQSDSELSAVHIARSITDCSSAMPDVVLAYLAAQFDADKASV